MKLLAAVDTREHIQFASKHEINVIISAPFLPSSGSEGEMDDKLHNSENKFSSGKTCEGLLRATANINYKARSHLHSKGYNFVKV